MLLSILKKIIGNPNENKINKMMGIVDHINALEPEFEKLTDAELQAKTAEFKEILAKRPKSDNPKADKILEKEAYGAEKLFKNLWEWIKPKSK